MKDNPLRLPLRFIDVKLALNVLLYLALKVLCHDGNILCISPIHHVKGI